MAGQLLSVHGAAAHVARTRKAAQPQHQRHFDYPLQELAGTETGISTEVVRKRYLLHTTLERQRQLQVDRSKRILAGSLHLQQKKTPSSSGQACFRSPSKFLGQLLGGD